MNKATLGKTMTEINHGLEKEYHDRNKPSILEIAKQKASEQNEQNSYTPNRNRGRKNLAQSCNPPGLFCFACQSS